MSKITIKEPENSIQQVFRDGYIEGMMSSIERISETIPELYALKNPKVNKILEMLDFYVEHGMGAVEGFKTFITIDED